MTQSLQTTALDKRFVAADFDKCSGCGVCELVCALEREKTFDPRCSRITVLRLHQLLNMPVACRLCGDAPCVPACPRDALKQSAETGVIVVDDEKCDACGWCIMACPYGAIRMHPTKKTVLICDLCNESPQCIEWCPEQALELVTPKAFEEKVRKATTKVLIPADWR